MGFFGDIFARPVGTALGGLAGGLVGQKDLGSKIGGDLAGGLSHLIPFKKGGMVKRTGLAKLHAGEMVVPKAMVHKVPKSLKAEIKRKGGRNM